MPMWSSKPSVTRNNFQSHRDLLLGGSFSACWPLLRYYKKFNGFGWQVSAGTVFSKYDELVNKWIHCQIITNVKKSLKIQENYKKKDIKAWLEIPRKTRLTYEMLPTAPYCVVRYVTWNERACEQRLGRSNHMAERLFVESDTYLWGQEYSDEEVRANQALFMYTCRWTTVFGATITARK